jgi:hypothetical protein
LSVRRTVGRAAAKTTLVPQTPNFVHERDKRPRRRGVDQWHVLEIEYQKSRGRSHAFENTQHACGSAKEERAADMIDHHVAIGGLLRIIVRAGVAIVGYIFERGLAASYLDAFRHPMEEQQRAEHDSDPYPGYEIDKNCQQEGCQEHDGIAAG